MKIVSLFSGAGGLDLGFIQAGHRVVWANDLYAADGAWHSVYVPFDGLRYHTPGMQNAPLDYSFIDMISVGCASRSRDNLLEVSHFYLVGD